MSDPLPASVHSPSPQKAAFGRSYWMLNSVEMFERLAYFGIRAVVPLYIMQATEPGGLHLTAIDKGWIYMWWAILQSWLPMFTGGIADRYGYKRVLFFAICTNSLGYLMMASFHSYHPTFPICRLRCSHGSDSLADFKTSLRFCRKCLRLNPKTGRFPCD